MKTTEDIVLLLNTLLNAEVFDNELMERSIHQFTEICESKIVRNNDLTDSLNNISQSRIVLMDFNFFTEEKMEQARLLKLENVKLQNFEYAQHLREQEKECQFYVDIKKRYGMEKSSFVELKDFLIYAYFGTAINDQLIKEFITKVKGFKKLDIRYLIHYLSNDD